MTTEKQLPTKGEAELPPDIEEDGNVDFTSVFDYLQSEQGHAIATQIVQIVDDVKKATIEKNYSHALFNRWMEVAVIVVVVVAVVGLSIDNKLNPTVGMLLGSIVGYFFGKSK